MERLIFNELKKWKDNPEHKPLVLMGARQVGKTWTMKHFAKKCFKNFVYISFVDSKEAHLIFEKTYSKNDLIFDLETLSGEKIYKEDTLIILDEIQECERALNSLKFFNENLQEYYVIAAGSLLGVAVRKKNMSFPVGQVEFLQLNPMSFYEFLCAMDEEKLAQIMCDGKLDTVNTFIDKYKSLFKEYLVTGGMPEVVADYTKKRDFDNVQKIQDQILNGYRNDFSKYIDSFNIAKVQLIFDSIPYQLSKENKKFSYKLVKSNARAREYESALEWLKLCGLIKIVERVSVPKLPLKAYADDNIFKVFFIDCGLLGRMAGLDPVTILSGDKIFEEFKGALAEQFVCQSLTLNSKTKVFYWTNDNSTSEIDFLTQYKNNIIPIEVKSGESVHSKSFFNFCEKFSIEKKVRFSLRNAEIRDGLFNLPLFSAEFFEKMMG